MTITFKPLNGTAKGELHSFKFCGIELRVLMLSGEPWFVAADVCRALGHYVRPNGMVEASTATRILNRDEVATGLACSSAGNRRVLTVSESGLYKLIMRSDKPEARKFQDWVTREVLPAIRKTGGYLLNEEARETAKADDRQAMPLPEGCQRNQHNQSVRV